MEDGLVCVKYKILTVSYNLIKYKLFLDTFYIIILQEGNNEITEIISHRCRNDLVVSAKQTSKKTSKSVYFEQNVFPKIKFFTFERKNIFLDRFKQ